MEILDKLEKVVSALKGMECHPEKVIIKNAPDDKLLVSVYYKDADKVDKEQFNKLIGDSDAVLDVPEVALTPRGDMKNNMYFNIFY